MLTLAPINIQALETSDITGHWANGTIQDWLDKGYISGYPDGSFKPDNDISRAEFMALVNKAYGYSATRPISFTDIKVGAWYYNTVSVATAAGYIAGYPDGTIRPNESISRQEAASIIMKINNLKGNAAEADKFSDTGSLTWSKDAVGAVLSAGIMKGYLDGSFGPYKMIKRAEATVSLDQALKHVAGQVDVEIEPIGDIGNGGSHNTSAIDPPNPIGIHEVLDSNGIAYTDQSGQIIIGSNGDLIMTLGSNSATFDGINCTLPYTPSIDATINPDFFRQFFGATYTRNGEVLLPSYAKTLLTNDFISKADLYQTEVTGEEAFLNAIDWTTGWDLAAELGTIGSSTEGWGFRTAGTEEGLEAALLVREKFEDILGIDAVKADQFSLYAWRYLDSALSITTNGGIDTAVPAISAVGTKATNTGGVTAEVVDIGGATKQDFARLVTDGIDLNGKIALIAVDLDYVPWQSQACFSAEQNGAIGVIYYAKTYYGAYVDGSNGQTAFNVQDWSGPEIDIPVLNVSRKDGIALKALLAAEAEPVTATIESNVEIVENSDKGLNVFAVIEGSKYPDEYVMVNAHSDAYFEGFQDDSIAVGAMASFAEAFVDSGIQPERSVILLKTDGEEFGVMDMGTDWLVGSWLLMRDNEEAQDWKGKIVASLTLELMAYKDATNFEMRASDTLFEYISTAAKGFTYNGHDANDKANSGFDNLGVMKNEVSNMSDEFTMVRYGVPTFRTNTHSSVVSQIYHSQFDNQSTTSEGKYADCLEYYGTYLIRLCNMPVAPYDLTKTAAKYETQVDFSYLSSLGFDDGLNEISMAYKLNAREMYLKNALILKLFDFAGNNSIDISSVDLKGYNADIRETTNTIIAESTHLSGEAVTLEVPFYINMTKTLNNGIASLEAGKGPASEVIFRALPARYYTNYLEYDAWYKTNTDNINLGARDVLWANDIKVQYLDIYSFYQGLKLKADGADFTSEISAAENWLETEAKPHLTQAVMDDISMFREANASLNAANQEADDIIDDLLDLCNLN
jgi:hypothetical protein